MFARAAPVPCRTADESSFSAQVSPAATSYPAAAIRRRASTPAAYQSPPFEATHDVQPVTLISSSAWNRGPSARIRQAWSERGCVLSATSGGTETKYSAQADGFAARSVVSRSQSVGA